MDKEITIPSGYPFAGKQLVEVISPGLLQSRIKSIGQEISDYHNYIMHQLHFGL